MGYDVWYNGEFTITPPLITDEIGALSDGDMRIETGWQDSNGKPHIAVEPLLDNPWLIADDGSAIITPDDSARSYYATEVLTALVKRLSTMGHTVAGEAAWNGEDDGDFGQYVVKDNEVEAWYGRRFYENPDHKPKDVIDHLKDWAQDIPGGALDEAITMLEEAYLSSI